MEELMPYLWGGLALLIFGAVVGIKVVFWLTRFTNNAPVINYNGSRTSVATTKQQKSKQDGNTGIVLATAVMILIFLAMYLSRKKETAKEQPKLIEPTSMQLVNVSPRNQVQLVSNERQLVSEQNKKIPFSGIYKELQSSYQQEYYIIQLNAFEVSTNAVQYQQRIQRKLKKTVEIRAADLYRVILRGFSSERSARQYLEQHHLDGMVIELKL